MVHERIIDWNFSRVEKVREVQADNSSPLGDLWETE